MYYTTWMAKIDEMDTPVVKAARRKDFWYLLEIAGVFIDWSPRFYIVNLAYIAFIFTAHLYIGSCLLVSMFRTTDLMTIVQYLNLFGLATIMIACIVSDLTQREAVCMLSSLGAAVFFDYGSSFSRSIEIQSFYKTGNTIKKILFVVVPTWLTVIALSIMMSDVVDAAFSYPKTNETIINGIHQTLPLKMYFYHPINNDFVSYAGTYIKLFNWTYGLVVFSGSIVVAMSMLVILQAGGQPSMMVTSILLIIAEVASIFLVCEVGETIRNESEELFDSMYAFKWMDGSVEVKKIIHIMKSCMKKPIVSTAASLTPMDRNTFGSIMNSAYSYMNLVLASGTTDAK